MLNFILVCDHLGFGPLITFTKSSTKVIVGFFIALKIQKCIRNILGQFGHEYYIDSTKLLDMK